MFNFDTGINNYLSEESKRKIISLLPLVRSMYPRLNMEPMIIPATADESISFIGRDNGLVVLQYSFWGNSNGDLYSITVYSNDVTLESLLRKFSAAGHIFGFKIKSIELDDDERPPFLDIMI